MTAPNPAARLLALADEAEALAAKATPGPWEMEYSAASWDIPEFCHVNGWTDNGDGDVLNLAPADAELCAASRTLVPALAAALRECVTVLGWYADNDSWDYGVAGTPDGKLDMGERAHVALSRAAAAMEG